MKFLNYVFVFTLLLQLSSCGIPQDLVYKSYRINDSLQAPKSLFYKNLEYSTALANLKDSEPSIKDNERTYRYGYKANFAKPLADDLTLKGFMPTDSLADAAYKLSIYDEESVFDFDCDSRYAKASLRYVIKDQQEAVVFNKVYTKALTAKNHMSTSKIDTTVAAVYKAVNTAFLNDLATLESTTDLQPKADETRLPNDLTPLDYLNTTKPPGAIANINLAFGYSNEGDMVFIVKDEFYTSKRHAISFGIHIMDLNEDAVAPISSRSFTEVVTPISNLSLGYKHYFNCNKGLYLEGGLLYNYTDTDAKPQFNKRLGFYANAGYNWRLLRNFSVEPQLFFNRLNLNYLDSNGATASYGLSRFGAKMGFVYHFF